MNTTVVRCAGITKAFSGVMAVDNVDLAVERGQILALLGPSGCGKTTVLRIIAGFESPDRGTVEINGQIVSDPKTLLVPEKRQVGMVFQEYAIFPHMNVANNIAFGLNRSQRQAGTVLDMLRLVNLQGMETRMPHELSGGERQRVALARALAPGPQVLLLDEPFSNLDAALRTQVQQETLEILKETSTTAVFVTHSQDEAMSMGDIIAVMNRGVLEQVDTPANIFHAPNSRFVASFMGVSTFLPARLYDDVLVSELGSHGLATGLKVESQIEIMIRPAEVSIIPSGVGQSIIRKKTFQGSFYLYDVTLPSGITIKCLENHFHDYELGMRVELRLVDELTPNLFVDGHSYEYKPLT